MNGIGRVAKFEQPTTLCRAQRSTSDAHRAWPLSPPAMPGVSPACPLRLAEHCAASSGLLLVPWREG